jgi:DNA polymerase III delta subunit
MIVTLSGDNRYLIDSELERLRNTLGLTSLDITLINGVESTINDISMELSGYSLFNDKRLVILSEPSKLKGFDEQAEQLFSQVPDSTTVAVIEPHLDKRKSYFKYLKANTEFKQLDALNGPDLVKWLSDYVNELGGQIATGDANYLVDRLGDNQLILSQEIKKLLLYSKKIDRESIDMLTERSASSSIFELLDAAFNLNVKQALRIYNDQRIQKVEPEQILAMISWQLNALAIYMTSKNLPSDKVAIASGLSPYTLSKTRLIASKITFSSLKQLVSDLSNLDLKSKTTSLDLDEGLKNFIVSLGLS